MSTIIRYACVLIVVLLGTCWAADGAPAVAQLTGRHTRVVWTQDAGPTASVFVEQPTLRLMGLDSRDGAGERVILAEQRGYWKPLLSADGKRVYFTDKLEVDYGKVYGNVYVVSFDGTGLTRIMDGVGCEDVWTDPATGVEWIYLRIKERRQGGVIKRFRADRLDVNELVWDMTEECGSLQVSGDGLMASGAIGGGNSQGLFLLPNGGFHAMKGGCWPSMAPDDSHRMWVFHGGHRAVFLFTPTGGQVPGPTDTVTCELTANAPGLASGEVMHPRWTNDVRYLVMSGPYVSFDWNGAKPAGELAAGVDIYLGRISADCSTIEGWAKVTANQRGDYAPDAWIEPQHRAAAITAEGAPAAHLDRVPQAKSLSTADGVQFQYLDQGSPSQIEDPASGTIRICNVTLHGRARYARYGLVDLAGGSALLSHGEQGLAAARASGAFTFACSVTPAAIPGGRAATIVQCASAGSDPDFALVQVAGRLVVRLKAAKPLAPPDEIPICAATAGQSQRIVVSCASGQVACYHNGVRLAQSPAVSADPSAWSGRLTLGGGTWAGTVSDVMVLSRAISADEAVAHDRAAIARAQGTAPAKQVVVDAVLVEATPAPDPRAIAPYTRCLSLVAYDVERVVSGELAGKRFIAAQWSVMDERQLPEYRALKPGARMRLTLEAFADHPEQESERQTSSLDHVEDFAVYYDVTPAAALSAP
ncbi:MAG: hypothetical protein H0W72_07550 [Planctomycetes bacterium]|nr:hypothetical protein [Planctomycetota bacterium]